MIDTLCRLLDAGVTQFHVVRECEAVLQDHLDIIADNRSELMTDTDPEAHAEKYEEAYEEEPQAQEEDE